jgi:hypothetical protein
MSKVNRNKPIRSGVSDSTYSLMEFERDYPDDAACLDKLVEWLYPDGIFCPNCKAITTVNGLPIRARIAAAMNTQ